MVVAIRAGRGPSLLASVLSVGALDLFFMPPYPTFAVSDLRYALTFQVMLAVGFAEIQVHRAFLFLPPRRR